LIFLVPGQVAPSRRRFLLSAPKRSPFTLRFYVRNSFYVPSFLLDFPAGLIFSAAEGVSLPLDFCFLGSAVSPVLAQQGAPPGPADLFICAAVFFLP
jgi:hypothetical protein